MWPTPPPRPGSSASSDAGVLVNTNGLGCLSTPMGDREVEELAVALERGLTALAREA
jgi:hypothetical protein